MAETVIASSGVTKVFRSGTSFVDLLRGRLRGARIVALDGVALRVRRGEIVALVGENGAGKSTLLRLVAGLLVPDEGTLEVLGQDAARAGARFRSRVCYVSGDERSFSWRLTGQQNLEFFAALYGLDRRAAARRVGRALEMTGMAAHGGRTVREYSSGMRQRLSLARGLLGDPELFLFDEPTRGVDPLAAARLRELIAGEILGPDHAAVVATHSLDDVAGLCHRVIALQRGKVLGEGLPDEVGALIGLSAATRGPAA